MGWTIGLRTLGGGLSSAGMSWRGLSLLALVACTDPSAGSGVASRPAPMGTTADTGAPTDTGTPLTPSEPLGTHEHPVLIDVLPYVASGDTRESDEYHIDVYACGPSDEGGAEVWYRVDLETEGWLFATVDEVDGDGVDVDVHLLGDTTPESCVARDDVAVVARVGPGAVFVVVDTWRDSDGVPYPGPFTLEVDFAPDASTGDCGADMVRVDDFCIDRYEAHLVGHDPTLVPIAGVATNAYGALPQGYISGLVAQGSCEAAGKRLCTPEEWLRACEGPTGSTYPYGNTYDPDACNEGRSTHPVVDLYGANATFSFDELNDPRLNLLPDSLATSGSFDRCVTAEGAYDMHGNLHEWVQDATGTFQGGFYVDASLNGPGCSYRTTAHSFDYHDYSTGFRCCAD